MRLLSSSFGVLFSRCYTLDGRLHSWLDGQVKQKSAIGTLACSPRGHDGQRPHKRANSHPPRRSNNAPSTLRWQKGRTATWLSRVAAHDSDLGPHRGAAYCKAPALVILDRATRRASLTVQLSTITGWPSLCCRCCYWCCCLSA